MIEGRTSELEPSRAAVWWMRRWPHSCPTRKVSEHLPLLILVIFLFVISERPVQCCCVDEPRPTSDCSFTSYSQSRGNVACRLKDYRRYIEGCYSDNHLTNNNDEIPGRVEGLDVSYYYTQCEQTLMEIGPSQKSDRCPTSCNENNGTYIAINITFKINANSASKLSALEIKLYGHSGGFHQGKTWCVLYEFGKGNVTYNDAVKHVFYYDGFIGLVPQYEYEVFVRTLPTARVDEDTWVKYKIKTRSCWSPFISWQSTPFTVDFNLTLNSEGYYNNHIQEYFIAVYLSDNTSSTRRTRTVQNIGDAVRKIVLRGYDPGIYTVEIRTIGTCESCLPYLNETYMVTGGVPPKMIKCPSNITLYTEVGGNMSVAWPLPSAISSCPKCPNLGTIKTKQSHQRGDFFQEGTSTEVRYEFWQYEADRATCSFYVHILSDTDSPVVTCSNVTLQPQSPNTFNGLIEGKSYTYSDSNPDPDGITYLTKGIPGDLFPPGHTPITLLAVDTFGNSATCLFYVENNLTELPVNCPSLNHSVTTDPGKKTHTFLPNLGKANITKSVPGYKYYGGDVSFDVVGGLTPGSSMPIGTHEMVVIISDDLLTKTCKGFYTVMDMHRQSPSVPVAVYVVIGVVVGIALVFLVAFYTIGSCGREPGKSRFETCKQKLRHLTGKTFDDQPTNDPKFDEFFSQSSVKEGDGIDLRVLQFAQSEYSSCTNINDDHTDSKVSEWIINTRQDRGDSGFEMSNDINQDHVINDVEVDGEKYHDRRVVNSQVHAVCEVHALGYGEKQAKSGKLDSGVGPSYNSQEHFPLDSDTDDDKYEGRDEIIASNKEPLLHHIPLTNSDVL